MLFRSRNRVEAVIGIYCIVVGTFFFGLLVGMRVERFLTAFYGEAK